MINSISVSLTPASWKGVRPIYKKLSDEFHLLTSAFNIEIEPHVKSHLDHLIVVIDEVDKCVDDLPLKSQRDDITRSLIRFLLDNRRKWNHDLATPELSLKMENIKQIIYLENIVEDFVKAAEVIFLNTELKRHTTEIDLLVNYIFLEGQATALLPLSVLKIPKTHPFGIFFSKLCMLMGIADLIFDARSDYAKNYIALRPNLKLYLILHRIMITQGFQLLKLIPRKLQFISYCMKFSFALLKGQ